jgi:hypothetical protein
MNDPSLSVQMPTGNIKVSAGKSASAIMVVTAKDTVSESSQIKIIANATLGKVVYEDI